MNSKARINLHIYTLDLGKLAYTLSRQINNQVLTIKNINYEKSYI